MSQGLLDAQNGAPRRAPRNGASGQLSRRAFLKIGAAAGGGLLLGISFSAGAQGDAQTRMSVIGGDGNESPQDGVFEPNAFVQIDRSGKVTLIVPKVEMGQGVYTSIPCLIITAPSF